MRHRFAQFRWTIVTFVGLIYCLAAPRSYYKRRR